MNICLVIGIFLCGAGAGALLTKIAYLGLSKQLKKEITHGELDQLEQTRQLHI